MDVILHQEPFCLVYNCHLTCKKRKYEHKKVILAFAASAMLAGGCTSLDMDPVSDITDLNYWKTPEQFDSFVFGLS